MISTKGRYALCVMIDLAEHFGEDYIPLKDIAERQQISKKYLESIVKVLVKGNMVIGVSGKGGGYRLSRNAEDFSIGEIIELTEGTMAAVACLKNDALPCPRADICETLPFWKEYDQLIHDFLYGKKLSDLIQ